MSETGVRGNHMQRIRQLHPLTLGVLFGTFFSRLGTFITMPFFAIYMTTVLKFDPVDVGWVLSISAIASLVMSFIGGTLSDRYGRRTMMLAGTIGFAVVFIALAQVETFWAFFTLSALNGVCRSIFEPSARALISDTTDEANRLFVFNIRYAMINIAAAIGPGIALLLSAGNTSATFYITAFVYIVYGVMIGILFKRHPITETHGGKKVSFGATVRLLRTDIAFTLALAGIIFGVFGYSQFNSTLPQFLTETSLLEGGKTLYAILITINAITVLIVQYPIMKFGVKTSPLVSITTGIATVAIGLFIMGNANAIWLMIVAMFIFTCGEVMMFTMTDILTDRFAKPELRGSYFGAMGLTSIGQSIGPIVGGHLLSLYGADRPLPIFGILAGLTLFGIPLLLLSQRIHRASTIEELEEPVKFSNDSQQNA